MINLINKILILVIILFLINHLTEGKILDTIKSWFNFCKEKFTNMYNTQQIPFAKQLDFPYINGTDGMELDDTTYHLSQFIESRVTKNTFEYEMTGTGSEPREVPNDMKQYIVTSLNTMFNSSGFKCENIRIIDKLVYFNNPKGKDIIPFKFSAEFSYKSKPLGTLLIHIESFIYEQYKGALYSIVNARLVGRNDKNLVKPTPQESIYRVNRVKFNMNDMNAQDVIQAKQQEQAKKDNKKLNDKLTESFNDVFIKPPKKEEVVDEQSSDYLPSKEDLLFTDDYEVDSITFTSENK
jgi:hypothetical protein